MFAVLFFLFSTQTVCFAEDTPRSLYDQGKYQEALDLLNKNGLNNAADYYNAANSLYRLGKVGQALSHYEKANALSPGNSDIRYNLEVTRAALEENGVIVKDRSIWSGYILSTARRLPEWLFNLLLAVSLGALGGIAFQAKRKSLRMGQLVTRPIFLMMFFATLFTLTLLVVSSDARSKKLAAVVADLGVARSGPNETFTELFKLPAGTTVELTGESREGWRQVRFSLGNVGWVMEKDLLPL
ncbi:MAG: tetratricopeptide repeat protein [Bdellovibrionota bacterium]